MARTVPTVQPLVLPGLTPDMDLEPVTVEGDAVAVGRVFLVVANAGASATTVTVQTPETVDGLAIEDRTISIPAGDVPTLISLSTVHYRQPIGTADAGRAYVDYVGADVANLTRAVVSLA